MKLAIGNVGDIVCVTQDVDSNNDNAGSCLNAELDGIDHELYGWEDAKSNIKRVPDINTSAFIYDDACDECIASSVDNINPFVKQFKCIDISFTETFHL